MKEEKKEKSVEDVLAEAVAQADLMPRGKWIVGKDRAEPPNKKPEKMEEKDEKSVLGSVASAVGVAAGVAVMAVGVAALVGVGLWNLAKYPDLDSNPEDEKMMKAPGRNYYMPRKKFEEDPKSYFRKLRGVR